MAEALSPAERHKQYARQAEWTAAVRNTLYRRAGLLHAKRVLDVGCGSGVIAAELAKRCRGSVVGIDLDADILAHAVAANPGPTYALADGRHLPFAPASFDILHCHFFLLWAREPLATLWEMVRVCRPGGHVIACAEPDYGGRLDYPPSVELRDVQRAALRAAGAEPDIGRRLRALFVEAGLAPDGGVVASTWSAARYLQESEEEWQLIIRTSGGLLDTEDLAAMRATDRVSSQVGTRFTFLPVFYAIAQRPG